MNKTSIEKTHNRLVHVARHVGDQVFISDFALFVYSIL